MFQKKALWLCNLLLAVTLALMLPACSKKNHQSSASSGQATPVGNSPKEARHPLKVALLCSGSFTDGGWNEEGRDAMLRLKRRLHLKVSMLEHVSPVRAGNIMRQYIARGYNLVIGHGYEFLDPASQVAPTSRRTHFAIDGADKIQPNVATLNFDLSQPSYQLGVLAAMLSKTGRLGFIGGEAIPSVVACYTGFLAGARSINPHITVAHAYTSWDQPALSKSQAEAFIQQHIDVIYQNVDAASRGVFEAVAAADRHLPPGGHPVYVFGSNTDQNDNSTCGAYTPASAVIRLDRAYKKLILEIIHGHFRPGVHQENSANGVCVTVLNPRLIGTVITPAMQRAVKRAGAQLQSGKIVISAG
jgi:basic membrane lipoprotein Med (substrate-binding protein (PBP1-ABC) superfamily)